MHCGPAWLRGLKTGVGAVCGVAGILGACEEVPPLSALADGTVRGIGCSVSTGRRRRRELAAVEVSFASWVVRLAMNPGNAGLRRRLGVGVIRSVRVVGRVCRATTTKNELIPFYVERLMTRRLSWWWLGRRSYDLLVPADSDGLLDDPRVVERF